MKVFLEFLSAVFRLKVFPLAADPELNTFLPYRLEAFHYIQKAVPRFLLAACQWARFPETPESLWQQFLRQGHRWKRRHLLSRHHHQ